ncbi:serine hydrolase domain-containing protein [Terriglobus roseus]|uniref:serine hydrolase domain-containing protein n=1 Tax=Terriglobus roseus TaxID=392734 RepID=UPI0009458B7D|nr:serine hydrolase domain-containing protein [Terriglobus roseus]
MRSSARSRNLALALLLIFVVTAHADGPSTDLGAPSQTVGQRLADDLNWTVAQRDDRFQQMDKVFPVHVVRRGRQPVLPLPPGRRLLDTEVAGYMAAEHLAGVLVLKDGKVWAERYALGLKPSGHWTGFSVTKAVTDTLAGTALRDGSLRSLDDAVTAYLPEMRGSAYDGVTVRQLMTMTSGVGWNESYTSSDADNVRLYTTSSAAGKNNTVEYMRTLPRDAPPGARWHYNTGETDLLGVLLRRATGKTLGEQLSAAIWKHAGMEHDATWIATAPGAAGEEFGGSGLSASLRDFGRLGLWVLRGGDGAVSPDWFPEATRAQVKAGNTAYGYGWWPQPDGSFAALGIFGQSILIDPQRKLVIVTLGDWPEATGASHTAARASFWAKVKAAVDSTAAH